MTEPTRCGATAPAAGGPADAQGRRPTDTDHRSPTGAGRMRRVDVGRLPRPGTDRRWPGAAGGRGVTGIVAVLAVAALVGCAGEPLRYHSLRDGAAADAPATPATPPTVAPAQATAPGAPGARVAPGGPGKAAALALHVVQVGMPALVDRAELVLATGDGGYTVLERQRWSASAPEEWRTALAARLVERLGARDIDGLGPRADEPVLRVRVMVRRIDSTAGRDVRLEADWTVALSTPPAASAAPSAQPRPLACSTRDSEAAGASVDAVVESTRRLVDRLADRIAAAATALDRGDASCPGASPS